MFPADASLIAGIGLGGLIALSIVVMLDPNPKERRTMPVIPDQIASAGAAVQEAYEVALSKSQDAHQREQEALQARQSAEDAKVAGREANAALQAKRQVFIELLGGFYVPPKLPD